jgi:hypothetical protein
MTAIDSWYRDQRNQIYGRAPQSGIRLTLGMVVWGEWYIDMFERVCLPSLLAPANAAALRDCGAHFDVVTSEADRLRVINILDGSPMPWSATVDTMPDAVIKADPRHFLALAAAQSLQVQRAAQHGQAFHPVMPDHCYNDRYFPNLSALALKYRNIAHGGLNVAGPATTADIEHYRRDDGSLSIDAHALATIGWRNTVMCAMNNNQPARMPDEHYQVWRARDRVMLFNPYANPVYMRPETARLMDRAETNTATLDTVTQQIFGADFYMPNITDDMCFLALSDAAPVPANNFTTIDKFLERMWTEIGGRPERLVYYLTPTEMACEEDATRVDAVQVMQAQRLLAREAAERKRIKA